jgi:hypothetical protein
MSLNISSLLMSSFKKFRFYRNRGLRSLQLSANPILDVTESREMVTEILVSTVLPAAIVKLQEAKGKSRHIFLGI